jgi:hypothetical protein
VALALLALPEAEVRRVRVEVLEGDMEELTAVAQHRAVVRAPPPPFTIAHTSMLDELLDCID